jgi:TonB-linked SusC/RagA family outer membrane protein
MKTKTPIGILIAFLFLPGFIFAQSERISINMRNASLNDVLTEIEKQCSYTFLVNQQIVDVNQKVDAVFENTVITDVLNNLFKKTDIQYVISNHQIILTPKKQEQKQQEKFPKKVTGTITDEETNEPMVGVTVLVKGTNNGTLSTLEGDYSIEVAGPEDVLVFTYVGYQPVEYAAKGVTQLNVQMHETSTELESVVVTALGIKRSEKALGYSIQKIDGDIIQTVKTSDPTTGLTGKISGLMIKNSTNFGTKPEIYLRGENPLIVVDGVPSDNVSINDISADDIKSIDVLKGATASALYGYRGANGAIMITTVRGQQSKGFSVSVNTSDMVNLGFLVTPETQKSYSSGYNGKYADDYVWGDKLDIGRTATLWDPKDMVWKENTPLVSKGKNNLKDFQEFGFVTNNNISILNQNENSSIRGSITYIYNKGQFPNQKLNKITYSLGGEIKYNKLSLESNISYSKHVSPNIRGSQYSGGYLYNLIGWLGAEWNINDYKNYWMVKNEKQNWFNEEWYDNPYFLANEVVESADRDILNGFVMASYSFAPWLKLSLRSGLDSYINRYISRNPISARNAWSYYGYYGDEKQTGYSINSDLILSFDKKLGDFSVDGLIGGTIFYAKDDDFNASTQGGLSVPGFYSLKASVDPIAWGATLYQHQVNSLYSRVTLAYKSILFVDLTGRNDWNSTLSQETRSYFYPSVSGSFLVSELLPKYTWLDFWKFRGSWTVSKTPAGIYDINSTYIITNEVWEGFNSATYPAELRGSDVRPQTSQTTELGTAGNLLKNRIRLDVTLYQKRIYDFLALADVSDATGFTSKYVNSQEERIKKGLEIMAGVTPVQTNNWKWAVNFNWSKDNTFYRKLDEQYTPDELWIKEGARVDAYNVTDWERDPGENMINRNGYPVRSNYYSVVGYSNPDWIWGLNSSLQYRSFTLSFACDGRVGGVSFSRLDALLWNSGAHIKTDNQWRYDEVVNGLKNYVGQGVKVVSGTVTYDTYGQITSDTREYAPNDVQVSYENYMRNNYARGAWSWCSQDILDETFIKLREVSLTYQVPNVSSEKWRMRDVTVSLIGQNLFYWGKEYKMSDPDYGETWDLVSPSIRFVGLNIKSNF